MPLNEPSRSLKIRLVTRCGRASGHSDDSAFGHHFVTTCQGRVRNLINVRGRLCIPIIATRSMLVILLGAVASAQNVTGPASRESPQGPRNFGAPMVIETRLAATDRSLWRGAEWFSIDEYHEIGRYSCEGVSLRRGYDTLAGTWQSGLELTVVPRGDKKVAIHFRATVTNPPGNDDKGVTIAIELLDPARRVVRKEVMTTFVTVGTESEAEGTLEVSRAFLDSVPAPTLRLTVIAKSDVVSPKRARITFFSILGGLLLIQVMSRF